MDDERKKPPLKRGTKAGGGKTRGPREGNRDKTGKATFSKPFRSGDKKPFVKRRDAEGAGDAPKRDFRRDDRSREAAP
jgi:23S rRNA pseudouridine2605 synthase